MFKMRLFHIALLSVYISLCYSASQYRQNKAKEIKAVNPPRKPVRNPTYANREIGEVEMMVSNQKPLGGAKRNVYTKELLNSNSLQNQMEKASDNIDNENAEESEDDDVEDEGLAEDEDLLNDDIQSADESHDDANIDKLDDQEGRALNAIADKDETSEKRYYKSKRNKELSGVVKNLNKIKVAEYEADDSADSLDKSNDELTDAASVDDDNTKSLSGNVNCDAQDSNLMYIEDNGIPNTDPIYSRSNVAESVPLDGHINRLKTLTNSIPYMVAKNADNFAEDENSEMMDTMDSGADSSLADRQKRNDYCPQVPTNCISTTSTCKPSGRPPSGPKLIVIPAECTEENVPKEIDPNCKKDDHSSKGNDPCAARPPKCDTYSKRNENDPCARPPKCDPYSKRNENDPCARPPKCDPYSKRNENDPCMTRPPKCDPYSKRNDRIDPCSKENDRKLSRPMSHKKNKKLKRPTHSFARHVFRTVR